MKPLVIYHANCADGFGAAFAAWLKLGDEAEYLPMQYGKQAEEFCAPVGLREVYILDFSFPRETMDHIFNTAQRVVWLDHHKTAFEAYGLSNDKPAYGLDVLNRTTSPHYVCLDNTRSGALIAWEYFHPDTEVPMLIKHIDDYDRWQFKIEGTKAFNKALWSYVPWSFEQWREINDHITHAMTISQWYREGEAILRAHDQNVQSVVKAATMACEITFPTGAPDAPLGYDRRRGLAANCPAHLSSDVGHELATQSGAFGLCWALGKDGKVKASLRSNGDYDVSAIAKAFGGGGHKNAAGFETDINTLMRWLK